MSDCFIKQALIARGCPTYYADILKQAVLEASNGSSPRTSPDEAIRGRQKPSDEAI